MSTNEPPDQPSAGASRHWKDRLPGYRALGRSGRKLRNAIWLLPAVVGVLFVRLLRPIVLIRFGWIRGSRLGHLVFETDLYLCERRAGLHPRRSLDLFYFSSPPCNRQLERMFRRRLWICAVVRRLYQVNQTIPGGAAHEVRILGRDTYYTPRDTHDLLADSPVNLCFTDAERRRGDEELRQLGIPPEAPIVCLHNRDSAYLRANFSHINWEHHDYRDFSVDDFRPTIDELLQRGYYVVRMGQDVSEALEHESPRVVDYASLEHSDLLDVYLCSRCRFFVGNTSGLFLLATAFRRPVLSVNHAPLGSVSICGRRDFVMPKLLWCNLQGRALTFAEVAAAGMANAYLGEEYAAAGLQVIDNDPDDIRAAVAELDDRLHGRFDDTPRDLELARQFERVYDSSDHLGPLRTRVAASFLRRYAELLSPAASTVRAA